MSNPVRVFSKFWLFGGFRFGRVKELGFKDRDLGVRSIAATLFLAKHGLKLGIFWWRMFKVRF